MCGIKLGSDIQAVLHNIITDGVTSVASGRIRLFSYIIHVGGTYETIYNYLLIASIITAVGNFGIVTIFALLNKQRR